ncbi:major capsid protein [Bacillus phage 031MP004]|nr:major capsid protein [Bacillus phage 031MP004]
MLTLDEFQGEEFQGYIENVPPARNYILSKFLPAKKVYDLEFAYNVINKTYSRTASITGFDSDVPLRDKDGLSQAFGEVAKVMHGFRVSEKELLRFINPRANTDEEKEAVEYVYDQTDNLIQGVYDIEEWMRAQVLYKGQLVYDENGVVLNIDFKIPTANKMTAATAWNATGATPLRDIQALVKQYRQANQNQKPAEIHISEAVWYDLLSSSEVIRQVYGETTDRPLVTEEQLNAVLTGLRLPRLVVQDMQVDNGNGAEDLLPERRIVAFGEGEVGKTFYGPTVEKNFQPGMFVQTKIENKPPKQEVWVGETIFPALQKPQAIVWMDV